MGFSQFKSEIEVARRFNLRTDSKPFVQTLPLENIPEYKLEEIKENFKDPLSFLSESATCEDIIKPILKVLDKCYPDFRVWSHVQYSVDPENDLAGIPDFLVARTTQIRGELGVPPLCVVEAKKADWDQGWAQALAEMYAASIQGATRCYAIVTTGVEWQFGQFDREAALFIKQMSKLSVLDDNDEPSNLQKLFDSLNWLFEKASRVEIVPFRSP
ncbi:hypothetical protein H206_02993 [Candidatus Electrothrix aarhusensis]|jgi:hypothetical protein|uniref:Type I restriction enzyme R protein N terminus (HSDR_N) n=1 Tax=Candidatus Electrothrix aarhusensis TaxID=1859131 RepID=A0A444IQT1_9BACT|nr:hypothetical protein H206_02993 [Candidatus Electrothrix aarhusensis]